MKLEFLTNEEYAFFVGLWKGERREIDEQQKNALSSSSSSSSWSPSS
jgi:hypothetical protein